MLISHIPKSGPSMGAPGSSLLFFGLLCIFFGLAILNAPELLAYFVATLLLLIGVSMLTMWWRVKRWQQKMK